MTSACGLTGKMAPLNSLTIRLWSSEKPIEPRFREAPTTAIDRGSKMGSSGRPRRAGAAAGGEIASGRSGMGSLGRCHKGAGESKRRQDLQALGGEADAEGQRLAAEVAVELGCRLGRAFEDDLLDREDLDVSAAEVGGAQEVEGEGQSGGAAGAAEDEEGQAAGVRAGPGDEAEGSAVPGDVRHCREGGGERAPVGDQPELGIAVASPFAEALPEDGGASEARLPTRMER